MNFYLEADEKEIAFYKHFKVNPIATISECSYHNLNKFGVELGTDVCEHTEDENFKCENCELSKEKIEWYPPIDSTVLLLIVLVCGTEELKTPLYYCTELIDKILNHAIIMSLNEGIYNKIKEVLTNHIEEYAKS